MEEIYSIKISDKHARVYESKTTYKKTFLFNSFIKDLDQMCEMVKDLEQKIPHLVPRTLSVNKNTDNITVIMEKVQGITLGKFLDEKHNIIEISKVVISLVEAVLSFHRAGYVHGDLHGGNILIKQDLSVVLIDFDSIEKYSEANLLKSGDYKFLKCHISMLIFQFGKKYFSVMEILEEAQNKKVEDIVGYDTEPEIAHCLFRLLKKFP
jgi:RIO-like serine/threonine protein kinase